jgi:hypothetical protein
MSIPVYNYRHFLDNFPQWRRRRDLFGFILFDDRQSHAEIKAFCEQAFNWLNALSDQAAMILFLPIKERRGGKFENCSVKIAERFNISPGQLPMILLFTLERGEMCVQHAAKLRFKVAAFQGPKYEDGEALVVDLFDAIREARADPGPDELVVKLQSRIGRIRRAARMRPIKRWAKSYGIELLNLPKDILREVGVAFGKGMVSIG